ncbi:MAG TPA: hypothetical protein V6C76_11740 [Drouetiella sp.]
MATLSIVLKTLTDFVQSKLASVSIGGQTASIKVGEGWPAEQAIQSVAAKNAAVIGIYDRSNHDDNRYRSRRVSTNFAAIGTTSALSSRFLENNTSVELTLSLRDGQNAVLANDAVSLVLDNNNVRTGKVASAVAGDTLATLATKLATQIATIDGLSATASGAVVTVSNTSGKNLVASTNSGNIGYILVELKRAMSDVQIICYCGTWDVKKAVSDILEVELAKLNRRYGFQTADQDWVQVSYAKQFSTRNDADTPANVYRRDYIMTLSFGITTQDIAYSVLVASANSQLF